jgi:hypothetical protein
MRGVTVEERVPTSGLVDLRYPRNERLSLVLQLILLPEKLLNHMHADPRIVAGDYAKRRGPGLVAFAT